MDIFIDPVFHEYYKDNPVVFIDAGASGGLNNNWKKARRYIRVIGFEPDKAAFIKLEKGVCGKTADVYINKALYKEKNSIDFYITKNRQLCSMFSPNADFLKQFPEYDRFSVSDVCRVDVDSLDNELGENNIKDADFIKIDTQGSELFVLEGAVNTLKTVLGLEIEVEFNEIYESQPLFSDVDNFLRSRGFCLFDIRPCYWKRNCGRRYGALKGQLIFADVLYLPDLNTVIRRLDVIEGKKAKKAKLLKAVSIAFLYGYIDYGVSMFEKGIDLFDDKEKSAFYKTVNKQIRICTRIPHFPGKGMLASVFKKLYNTFRYSNNGWATGQEKLGNLD